MTKLKQWWPDLLALALLLWLFARITQVVIDAPADQTQWLLVYLTAIYALLTLYLAAAALRSAGAAERSAKVMEDSLDEQRRLRFAQFAAVVGFPAGHTYEKSGDRMVLRFSNPFSQPILDFRVLAWMTESSTFGEREVRYGSMMVSESREVRAEESTFEVVLSPSPLTESECRAQGEVALERFKQVYQGKTPQGTLCAVVFAHRFDLNGTLLVFDFNEREPPNSPSLPSGGGFGGLGGA